MDISLNIIVKELPYSIQVPKNMDRSIRFSQCMLYEEGSKLTPEILYVAQNSTLPAVPPDAKGTIITDSPPPRKSFSKKLSILIVQKAISIPSLFNQLLHIFWKYNTLDRLLLDAVYQGSGLQYMLDTIAPFFGNELSIMNSNFQIVAQTQKSIRLLERADLPQPDRHGYLPLDLINYFKNDKEYLDVKNQSEPFFYNPSIFLDRVLCINVFYQKEMACRIVLTELDRQIDTYDCEMLRYFAKYVEQSFHYYISGNGSLLQNNFASMMLSLLNGKQIDRNFLNNYIDQLNWHITDYYLCACILPSSRDLENRTIPYYCSLIQQTFPDIYTIEFDQYIVCLINLKSYQNDINDFLSQFVLFQREAYLRIGLSDIFTDIEELRSRFTQAKIALQTGSENSTSSWTFRFDDFFLDYLKAKMTEDLDSKYLITSEVKRLIDYDQLNHTDYTRTLHSYLNNNMNALQTSADLFIHRATMVYRLDRIKKIAGLNYDDPLQMLRVRIILHFFLDGQQ